MNKYIQEFLEEKNRYNELRKEMDHYNAFNNAIGSMDFHLRHNISIQLERFPTFMEDVILSVDIEQTIDATELEVIYLYLPNRFEHIENLFYRGYRKIEGVTLPMTINGRIQKIDALRFVKIS